MTVYGESCIKRSLDTGSIPVGSTKRSTAILAVFLRLAEPTFETVRALALRKIQAKVRCYAMKYKVCRANRVHILTEERVELARKRQGEEYSRSEIPLTFLRYWFN